MSRPCGLHEVRKYKQGFEFHLQIAYEQNYFHDKADLLPSEDLENEFEQSRKSCSKRYRGIGRQRRRFGCEVSAASVLLWKQGATGNHPTRVAFICGSSGRCRLYINRKQ